MPRVLDDIIDHYSRKSPPDLVNLRLRVPAEIDNMLKTSADKNGRSFNSELCYRLSLSLKEHP